MPRTLAALVAILVTIPATGQDAAILDDRISELVAKHEADILEFRHYVHQNPELGNREHETAKRVAAHLTALGMEVRTGMAHTGVVGILKGGKPGRTIAVRAAVQYGVASILAEMRDEIPGTVVFIFQPAEEGPPEGEEGGADLMVREGVFDDPKPEAVFGLHTLAGMPVGDVGFTAGPALAAVDQFRATVRGVQTHGAQPQQGVDPIVMASQAVLALQTIVSRNVHPLEPAVVTVGMFHSGARFNIIPAEVKLEGTVRTYDPDVRDLIERRMNEILGGITSAGGGSYVLDYERGTPATINDTELTAQMAPSLGAVLGTDRVQEILPTMGGEDFAYFALEVPGFFYRLGIHKEGSVIGPHHSPTFRADDASVPVGMRVMSNVLMDYLLANAP